MSRHLHEMQVGDKLDFKHIDFSKLIMPKFTREKNNRRRFFFDAKRIASVVNGLTTYISLTVVSTFSLP